MIYMIEARDDVKVLEDVDAGKVGKGNWKVYRLSSVKERKRRGNLRCFSGSSAGGPGGGGGGGCAGPGVSSLWPRPQEQASNTRRSRRRGCMSTTAVERDMQFREITLRREIGEMES